MIILKMQTRENSVFGHFSRSEITKTFWCVGRSFQRVGLRVKIFEKMPTGSKGWGTFIKNKKVYEEIYN